MSLKRMGLGSKISDFQTSRESKDYKNFVSTKTVRGGGE
jgi:hypothetical protein